MKRKIINVETYGCDGQAIDIDLDNNSVIQLSLREKQTEPLFAEVVNERLKPRTDGRRIYWNNGANLTFKEITEMLLTDSEVSDA